MKAAIGALRLGVAAPDDRVAGVLYWYALSGALARLAAAGRDAASAPVRSGSGGWPEPGRRHRRPTRTRASRAPSTH
ncbi:hypothetical protein [Tsukamurella sp. PLM1]|uniref:hypothetical protein n=1 Tax=Tsukamurella sp. PLM1 TaxID=2929795 RepID=UPI00206A4D44|nr:hypothetical protein [Tsukamurella sp. PLM1]BDH57174.1 hypothetical protein MTP03_21130 [Tsukamurella sp. PLM1]